MSLLYDSWLIPLLSMNQDAFLYNTLAHDTTTPHGYQRAANVGTKSHQHKIKHGNRRNKHPRKIPEKSWYESCEVPRGMNFIWIAFLVVLLEIQRSIRPMSFHATLPSWQGFAAQRSGSGSSNMLWPRQQKSPSSVPVAWCPTSWRFKGHLSIWTWGRHSLEVSNTQFSQAILPAWSCHVVRLWEWTSYTSLRPAVCCSLFAFSSRNSKLKSKSVPQKKTNTVSY